MEYEPTPGLKPPGMKHGLYNTLVVPRPIGWISTVGTDGVVNLAPYSFFNVLSYDPPFVFSAGAHEADGAKKDTVANIEATGEFVYNMATWAQKDQMNQTALIIERCRNSSRASWRRCRSSTCSTPCSTTRCR